MSIGNYENLGEYAIAKCNEWLAKQGYSLNMKELPISVIEQFQKSDEFADVMAKHDLPAAKVAVAITFRAYDWMKDFLVELKKETAYFNLANTVEWILNDHDKHMRERKQRADGN